MKKRNYFTKYGEEARQVLEALLDKYADEVIENIESLSVLNMSPFTDFGERYLGALRHSKINLIKPPDETMFATFCRKLVETAGDSMTPEIG